LCGSIKNASLHSSHQFVDFTPIVRITHIKP
jgi:hypothetical protein